jgi:hypothetical protein
MEKKTVILTGFSLATVTGHCACVRGKPFFFGCRSGAAIGSFYGWLIPRLHRRNTEQRTGHVTLSDSERFDDPLFDLILFVIIYSLCCCTNGSFTPSVFAIRLISVRYGYFAPNPGRKRYELQPFLVILTLYS